MAILVNLGGRTRSIQPLLNYFTVRIPALLANRSCAAYHIFMAGHDFIASIQPVRPLAVDKMHLQYLIIRLTLHPKPSRCPILMILWPYCPGTQTVSVTRLWWAVRMVRNLDTCGMARHRYIPRAKVLNLPTLACIMGNK